MHLFIYWSLQKNITPAAPADSSLVIPPYRHSFSAAGSVNELWGHPCSSLRTTGHLLQWKRGLVVHSFTHCEWMMQLCSFYDVAVGVGRGFPASCHRGWGCCTVRLGLHICKLDAVSTSSNSHNMWKQVHISGVATVRFWDQFRCKFREKFAPESVNRNTPDCKPQPDMCEPSPTCYTQNT